MNIIRNIFCEGVFEGTYILKRREQDYIWIIIETKDDWPRLHIKRKRDNNCYESATYHYGRTIPFKEADLNGDF